jgi:hypothetical protein
MRIWIGLLGITIIFFISNQGSFAQDQRQCIPNQICVMPHDYLKYQYDDNRTRIIYFGDFISPFTIKVSNTAIDLKLTSVINYSLNLKNGILTDSNGTQSQFYFILPIPVDSKKIDTAYVDELVNFNGYSRDTYGMHIHNETHIINSNIDKETGIWMNNYYSVYFTSNSKDLISGSYLRLLDTNMIASSTPPLIQQNNVPEFGSLVGSVIVISIISVIVASRSMHISTFKRL